MMKIEDKELIDEINRVFGTKAMRKLDTIICRYEYKIDELKQSRANWRKKYEDLKSHAQ